MTLEEIRGKLEFLYPEFSKERTKMEYDKRHFVIPILQGSSKGVRICSRSKEYALYIVEGRDKLLYRIEKTPIGQFAVCLSEPCDKPEFHFSLPRIPSWVFDEAMSFFILNKTHEVACQIFYTMEEGYSVYYPQQKYSTSAVSFLRNPQLEAEKTLVMDLHSHGSLPAFFSQQDNRDEKGTRLFFVAGNLHSEPQIRIRAGIIGRFVEVNIEDIFA